MEYAARSVFAAVLTIIAVIHLYWAAGGSWGLSVAIPSLPGKGGRRLLKPGSGGTLGVASLLLIGAAVAMGQILPAFQATLLRLMAAVFAIRAVGEFRYLGFFKRVLETQFAYWDTRLFSPLCLMLSFLALAGSGLFDAVGR